MIPNLAASGFAIVNLRGGADGNWDFDPGPRSTLSRGTRARAFARLTTRCGWEYGPTRDDVWRQRPDLVPWPGAERGQPLVHVRLRTEIPAQLLMPQLGYEIRQR